MDITDNRRRIYYTVEITLPDKTIKSFRTDEYNPDKVVDRFEKIYGRENITVIYKTLETKTGI